jgi:hypothetical protein
VSGDARQPSQPELLAELEALLARAGNAQRRRRPPVEQLERPLPDQEPLFDLDVDGDELVDAPAEVERAPLPASAPPPPTPWQRYANELRDLCQRVLEEADEETAVAFWLFLVETAARHGRRGWPA